MKTAPFLQSVALAATAAVVSWWLTKPSAAPPSESSAAVISATSEAAPLPPTANFSLPSTAGGTLQFIQSLRQSSPAELQTAFNATRDSSLREAVIMRWAALDPSGCFEFLCRYNAANSGDPSLMFSCVPILFQQWARVSQESAINAIAAHKSDGWLSLAFTSFMETSASLGGPAWQAIIDDPRLANLQSSVGRWPRMAMPPGATVNILKAAEAATRAGRYDLRNFCAYYFGRGSQSDDSNTLVSTWKGLPPSLQTESVRSVVSNIANSNLPAAVEFTQSLAPHERENAACDLTKMWAKQDPAAAWTWLSNNLQGGKKDAARIWGSEVEPVRGAAILQEAPPSSARDTAAATMAENWLARDPAAATAWASTLDDSTMQRIVFNKIAETWTDKDPDGAIAAFTAPGAAALTSNNYKIMTQSLKKISPEKARAFVDALPPARAQSAAKGL